MYCIYCSNEFDVRLFSTLLVIVLNKSINLFYVFQAPRQLIHIHPFSADQDIPEYDMDSEDEEWLNQQAANGEVPLTNLKFEEMMDRLEKVNVCDVLH